MEEFVANGFTLGKPAWQVSKSEPLDALQWELDNALMNMWYTYADLFPSPCHEGGVFRHGPNDI